MEDLIDAQTLITAGATLGAATHIIRTYNGMMLSIDKMDSIQQQQFPTVTSIIIL